MSMPGTTIGGGGAAVLEDPTGTRVLWMRRAGRVVFLLFLSWLLAIVLGGLGLVPVAGIPLTHIMRPSQGPPPLAEPPRPRTPSASDLRPAVAASVFAARAENTAKQAQQVPLRGPKETPAAGVSHAKSRTAPGKIKTRPALPAARGRSSVAPTARGRSSVAPGHRKTVPATGVLHGKSKTAPGKIKTGPALPAARGRSSVAPGQTKTTTSVRKPKKP